MKINKKIIFFHIFSYFLRIPFFKKCLISLKKNFFYRNDIRVSIYLYYFFYIYLEILFINIFIIYKKKYSHVNTDITEKLIFFHLSNYLAVCHGCLLCLSVKSVWTVSSVCLLQLSICLFVLFVC